MDYDAPIKEICPDCGSKMYSVSHHFRPPKKTDDRKWKVAKFLIEKGFNYDHIYEMIDKGVYRQLGSYPETMKEAEDFVKSFNTNGIKKLGI